MEGMALKSTSVLVRQLLGSLTYSDLWLPFLGLIANPKVLTENTTCLQLPTLPHHPPAHPLHIPHVILQWL